MEQHTIIFINDEMNYPSLYLVNKKDLYTARDAYNERDWKAFHAVTTKLHGASMDLWGKEDAFKTIGISFSGPIKHINA